MVEYESKLIKSTLVIKDSIRAIYLVDGTKINIVWDKKTGGTSLNIEKTPTYSTMS